MFVAKLAPAVGGGSGTPAPYDERYVYDAVGNFVGKAGVAYAGHGQGAGKSGRAHAPATVGGAAYAYDANGNMTGGGNRTYTWDTNNQPTSIVGPDSVTEIYGYGADGGRISRARAGVTTVYVAGVWEEDFQAGASREKRSHYSLQGKAVAQRTVVTSPASNTVTYLHGDHLGSVSLATRPLGRGTALTRQAFTLWGELRPGSGDIARTTRGFTGQRRDGTGLRCYHARHDDPRLGRFVSPDRIVPGTGQRSLTVDSHESNLPGTLRAEHDSPPRSGFWFRLDRRERQRIKTPWGPGIPQPRHRRAYAPNNPLRSTDRRGHGPGDGQEPSTREGLAGILRTAAHMLSPER